MRHSPDNRTPGAHRRVSARVRRVCGTWVRGAASAFCLAFALQTNGVAEGSGSYLVVRYDDYAPVTPYDRGSNGIEVERRLFEMFARHNARLTLGVIPFPVAGTGAPEHDPAKLMLSDSWLADPDNPWVRLLRESVDRGVVEPALHGFEHRRRSATGHRPGEFRDQPYEWQLATITLGRVALSAAVAKPIRVFIPPWNAWDSNTARALAALDFTWLSPDLQHAELPTDTLRVAPQCTANPAEAIRWMRTSDSAPPGAVVVLVTHPFDFYGPLGEAYFRDLEQLLTFVSDSRDWAVVGFEDLPHESPSDCNRRFHNAVAWDHAREILADMPVVGGFLAPAATPFQPECWYTQRTWRLQLLVAAVMTLTVLVGYLLAVLIARRSRHSTALARIAAAATVLALIVLIAGAVDIVVRGYLVRGIRWQAISGTSGLLIGFAAAAVRRTARRDTIRRDGTSRASHERDEHPIGRI